MSALGERVCTTLTAVIEPAGGIRARPTDLARQFGLNKSVASRLLKALRTPDPVAALGALPGPEALRSLIAAAPAAARESARDALSAVDDLERFIRDEVGGRDGLAAVLSEAIPEQRERFELGHKQAAHRAMANLMGVSAEVDCLTLILFKNREDPERIDALNVHTLRGVRQRRPGAVLNQVHRFFSPDPATPGPHTLEGEPVGDPRACVIWTRTSVPPERMRVAAHGEHTLFAVEVGPIQGDGFDLTTAYVQPRAHFARPQNPHHGSGVGLTVDLPARLGVVELLVAPGVWEGRSAQVLTHMLGSRGAVNPNDPVRAVDRLRLHEQVETVTWDQFRIAEIHDHPGTIALLTERVGVDARSLRGHRVRSLYPLVGTQVSLNILPS